MITSNLTNVALLCNSPIRIIGDRGESYMMRLPTLRDKVEDPDFNAMLGFCSCDLKKMSSELNVEIKTHYDLYRFYENNKMKNILKVLHNEFMKYMIDSEYVDERLMWNKRIIPWRVFNFFCDYFSIAAGTKSIEDLSLVIQDDMDEMEKQRIRNELRIRATKKQGSSDGLAVAFEKIMAAVAYEFGYKMSELYDMTIAGIYFLYSQIHPIMNYQISNIAIGNGNVKKGSKHYYWADPRNK